MKTLMNHFNKLTPGEAERLAILSEELGEAIQAIGKILRHGYDSSYNGVTNRESLVLECGDVDNALMMLVKAGDIKLDAIWERSDEKAKKILQYLHHQ